MIMLDQGSIDIIGLVERANASGLKLSIADGDLIVRALKSEDINSQLLADLKANKTAVLRHLSGRENVNDILSFRSEGRDGVNRKIQPSFGQERLWFIDQLEGSKQYHLPWVLRLKGDVNVEALEHAFRNIIHRHEVLRTVIRQEDGIAFLDVLDHAGWSLNIIDNEDLRKDGSFLASAIDRIISVPFDLATDFPIRADIIVINRSEYVLVVTIHHISSDGWSLPILVKELMEFYNSRVDGRQPVLKELPIQYSDYAAWQRSTVVENDLREKLQYWESQLNGVSTLDLPSDFVRPAVQSNNGAVYQFRIDKVTANQARKFAQENGVTLFITLLAAFNVLMYRYSGQSDICVGTVVANRGQAEVEGLIGFFVNMLALRNDLSGDPTFIDLLQRVKETTLDAYDHQDVPFEKVVESVVKERDRSRSPLFQVVFQLQNNSDLPAISNGLKGIEVTSEGRKVSSSRFDLTFSIEEDEAGLLTEIEYCTGIFTEHSIARMARHYELLVQKVVQSPGAALSEFNVLPPEEISLLDRFNNTGKPDCLSTQTVVQLFESQVLLSPNAVAVACEERELTYEQLDAKARALANFLLIEHSLQPGEIVGITSARSEQIVIAILGIWKARGAYLPIDTAAPSNRVAFMIKDSATRLLLTDAPGRISGEEFAKDLIVAPIEHNDNGSTAPGYHGTRDDVAYVMYTSGSTGVPKGVVIQHSSVVNFLNSMKDEPGITREDTLLALTTFAFDISVLELFLPLVNGSTVIIASQMLFAQDSVSMWQFLNGRLPTILQTTPSFLKMLMDAGHLNGRRLKILCGGESLSNALARRVLDEGHSLWNMYGPTETTIWSAIKNITSDQPVSIGRGIANTQIYILDDHQRLCPVGVIGEIYIAGDGLARGYLNRPEQTAERFVKDPFRKGCRMYRTGDLGRWQADGNVVFLRRNDSQVKIRGYRIEPGEIENVIQKHPLVKDAVVLVFDDHLGKYLTAYVIGKSNFNSGDLKKYLSGLLPEYMVPSYIVELAEFPLTANGKVDRKMFVAPKHTEGNEQKIYEAPRNEVEEKIAKIWEEVLQRQPVGIHDNFFELGGDSIRSIQIVSRLRKFGYTLKVTDVLQQPILKQLAERVTIDGQLAKGFVAETLPLSAYQTGMLEYWRADKQTRYHTIELFDNSHLSERSVAAIIKELAIRHDALGAGVALVDGKWWQEIQANSAQLSADAVFHVDLSHDMDGNHLKISVDSLIADATSMQILLDDFSTLFNQWRKGEVLGLGKKPGSFKGWLLKQDPSEKVVGSSANRRKPKETCTFSRPLASSTLGKANLAYGTDAGELVLTAFSLAWQLVQQQDRVTLKVDHHGRNVKQFDRTVGCFRTTRMLSISNCNPERQLIEVKEMLRRQTSPDDTSVDLYVILNLDGNLSIAAECNLTLVSTVLARPFPGPDEDVVLTMSLEREELTYEFKYSPDVISLDKAEQLKSVFDDKLDSLIESCLKHQQPILTPSDLTYRGLGVDELDDLQIRKPGLKDVYEMTLLQRGMFFHYLNGKGSPYFNQTVVRIHGRVDVPKMKEAFRYLCNRHESLKTQFLVVGEAFLQVLLESIEVDFRFTDMRGLTVDQQTANLERLAAEDRAHGFDLENDPLIRLFVTQLTETGYELIWSYHHILMDGWCISILVEEFFYFYSSLIQGRKPDLPASPGLSEYVRWLSQLDQQGSLNYWRSYLKGFDRLSVIPGASPADRYIQKEVSFQLDTVTSKKLDQVGRSNGVTLNSIFQAAWGTLLAKYNNTEDVVFGVVVSGRPPEINDIESLVGLFINTIPVRVKAGGTRSFSSLAREVNDHALQSNSHQYVQLSELQAVSELKSGLFDHIVAFENYPVENRLQGAVSPASGEFSVVSAKHFEQTNFDFNIVVTPGSELDVKLMYNGAVYDDRLVLGIQNHLRRVLTTVALDPQVQLRNIGIIDKDERYLITEKFNQSTRPYDLSKTMVDLFEKQVELFPGRVAIVCAAESITYAELNSSANKLANFLIVSGIKNGDVIGVCMEASIDMVSALLGVLKSGASYLLFHPLYPCKRIEYTAGQAAAKAIVVDQVIPDLKSIEQISFASVVHSAVDISNPARSLKGSDLACMTFTSVLTGNAKVCGISHANLSNYIQWCHEFYFESPDQGDFCLITPSTFDLSITSLYAPITRGRTLHIRNTSGNFDQVLKDSLGDPAIDTIRITSSHLSRIRDLDLQPLYVRNLICSGEQLDFNSLHYLRSFKNDIRIFNEYGPNQIAVGCIACTVSENEHRMIIGKPIANTRIFIVGSGADVVPVGVVGEIVVSGAEAGSGYLDAYKTGDLARWDYDGCIELVGRAGREVRVDGHRVELSEIERILLGHETVRNATVIDKDDTGHGKYLVAFIVPNGRLDIAGLSSHLLNWLPSQILPRQFVEIDAVPVTSNGKTDKAALAAMLAGTGGEATGRGNAPEGEKGVRLASIWQKILGRPTIGVNEDFFETGGHSLKVVQLMSRIKIEFGVDVRLEDLFQHRTMTSQLKLIENADQYSHTFIPILPPAESYPLSPAQYRFWALDQLTGNSSAYNIRGAYILKGHLDVAALSNAFSLVISRHESIRTVFKEDVNGEVRQYILDPADVKFDIEYASPDEMTDIQNYLRHVYLNELVVDLNDSSGILLKVKVVRIDNDVYGFFCAIHHIIGDGWSLEIIAREVMASYNAFRIGLSPRLSPLKFQYKDYAAWQYSDINNERHILDRVYWLNVFADKPPVIDLPTGRLRPTVQTYSGVRRDRSFTASLIDGLRKLCLQEGTTLFTGLAASLKLLLYRYTGTRDITIGTMSAGRLHPDMENQVGLYFNTLALRTKIEPDRSFAALLRREKTVLAEAYSHQLYPFDQLVMDLGWKREVSRSPLFDIMIILQNQTTVNYDHQLSGFSGLHTRNLNVGEKVASLFDLEFSFTERQDGGLDLSLNFADRVYDCATVDQLCDHFESLLNNLPGNTNERIDRFRYWNSTQFDWLSKINGSGGRYQVDLTISQLFEEQVRRTPQKIAARDTTGTVSYATLNERSNIVAWKLKEKRVGPDVAVAVLTERSIEMLTCMLGVWKAGGACVLIDPDLPDDEKTTILDISSARTIITDRRNYAKPDIEVLEIVNLSGDEDQRSNPPASSIATDLCVLNTLKVEHRSVLNHIYALIEELGLDGDSNVAQTSPTMSNAMLWQMISALMVGGATIIYSDKEQMNRRTYLELLNEHGVTIVEHSLRQLPGVLEAAAATRTRLPKLKRLVTSYNNLITSRLRLWFKHFPAIPLVSIYRPGGTMEGATLYYIEKCPDADQVPAGRPSQNTALHIVDGNFEPCPPGVPGQVLIDADRLSRGCVVDSSTALKFREWSGHRVYLTGDIARWLPDGNVVLHGNVDSILTEDGNRIDLRQVENVLLDSHSLKDVFVAVREKESVKILDTYVIPGHRLDRAKLKTFLQDILPEFITRFPIIEMDEFPLTSDGYVDKEKMPLPADAHMIKKPTETIQRSEVEKVLIKSWQQVLGKENIGTEDNFFEQGGDSIRAIQVASRLRKYGYTLKVTDILQQPVLKDAARRVNETMKKVISDSIPLTSYQLSLLQYTPDQGALANLASLVIPSEIEFISVERLLVKLLERHEMLRARFYLNKAGWHQTISDVSKSSVIFVDPGTIANGSFDLNGGVLIRFAIEQSPPVRKLTVAVHPIVCDINSLQIVIEDIRHLLEHGSIPQEQSAGSFNEWSSSTAAGFTLQQLRVETRYWKQQMSALRPVTKLNSGAGRDFIESETLVAHEFEDQLLASINGGFNTNLQDVLLCALALSVSSTMGVKDMSVYLRMNARTSNTRTVGCFTTVYPIKFEVLYAGDVLRQLIEIKETIRKIPGGGSGFGMLVHSVPHEDRLQLDVDQQLIFTFEDADIEHMSANTFIDSQAGLRVKCSLNKTRLVVNVRSRRDVFEDRTVSIFNKAFVEHLDNLISQCLTVTTREVTPSDLGSGISMDDFNDIFQ